MSQTIPPVEDIQLKGYDPQVTRRLLVIAHPYLGKIILALIFMLASAIAAVSGPYLVKIALDSGLQDGSWVVLRQTVLLYLLVSVFQWALNYLRINIMAQVGQSIIFDLRASMFNHLQNLSLSFFSHYSVGRVITRVINDVEVLREFITWAVLATARDVNYHRHAIDERPPDNDCVHCYPDYADLYIEIPETRQGKLPLNSNCN